MAGFTMHPDYEALPEPIKRRYTPEEYAWLGDRARKTLMDRECYPDLEDDDQ
jgi:hypothetical protein